MNNFWIQRKLRRIPLNIRAMRAEIITKALRISRLHFEHCLKHLTVVKFSPRLNSQAVLRKAMSNFVTVAWKRRHFVLNWQNKSFMGDLWFDFLSRGQLKSLIIVTFFLKAFKIFSFCEYLFGNYLFCIYCLNAQRKSSE